MPGFQPKKLFIIDGIGAMVSAFLLGFVLVKLEPVFGIPSSTLYLLATLPIFFAAFDLFCYKTTSDHTGRFLKIIATLNFCYCCLSIGCAMYHFESITGFGWAYIIVEILVVLTLAMIEYRTGHKLLQSGP